MSPAALAIHGGAGLIRRESLSPERERACTHSLHAIMEAVKSQLDAGMSALDAVEEAVIRLEDDPLFNAGRGEVNNTEEGIEFDASIMDGTTGDLGALGGVRFVRNPITLARVIMEKTPHVMLGGVGAEEVARRFGLPMEDLAYFHVEERLEQLRRAKETGAFTLDHDDDSDDVYGTVGAVALDIHGNLAAATSTGGMTGKPDGRIGDTAIIGAGTWADDQVAISCTGVGEAFIRTCAAHEVATQIRLGQDLEFACSNMLEMVAPLGGRGGVIAVDSEGNVSVPFQTMLMYRAIWKDGQKKIGIGPSWV